MEWLPPLLGLIVLAVFIAVFLTRKNKPKEVVGVLFFAIALFIYHVGDVLMWGWGGLSQGYYEVFRRIASLGYYLEIPALLYLGYYCIPEEKRTQFTKIFSWILVIPWVVAVLLIIKMPNNYLLPPNIPDTFDPGVNLNLIYALIVFYIIGVVFVAVKTIKGAKLREGGGKSLCKTVGIVTLIQLVAYLIIFSFAETYDATYLFGLISIFWIVTVGKEAMAYLKEA